MVYSNSNITFKGLNLHLLKDSKVHNARKTEIIIIKSEILQGSASQKKTDRMYGQ